MGSRQSSSGAELAIEIRAVNRLLRQRVREQGNVKELTPSQVSVLARLEKDGSATASSLARAEGMRPQSMREVVAPLQSRGLVGAAADPDDGRQILMSLTPAGRKWISDGRAASHDWLTDTIARRLSAPERQALGAGLELLRRLLEP